jgi:hypothetical protein
MFILFYHFENESFELNLKHFLKIIQIETLLDCYMNSKVIVEILK